MVRNQDHINVWYCKLQQYNLKEVTFGDNTILRGVLMSNSKGGVHITSIL